MSCPLVAGFVGGGVGTGGACEGKVAGGVGAEAGTLTGCFPVPPLCVGKGCVAVVAAIVLDRVGVVGGGGAVVFETLVLVPFGSTSFGALGAFVGSDATIG